MLKSFFKKIISFLFLLCFTSGTFCLYNLNIVSAQGVNQKDYRQLVIGDLLGRTDIREIEVFTKFGYVSIFGSENNKPFDLVNSSPAHIELRYNPSYGLNFNNPHSLLYKFYDSERALISALILDEVDFAVLENEVSAREVASSNNHFLPLPLNMTPNTVKLICYNYRNKILKSSKVRIALAYAINHNHIINKIILGGKANIARGPFDDDSPLYNSGMESYKYSPKSAIELLKMWRWWDSDDDGILDTAGVPFRITLYFQKGLILDEAISRQIRIDLLKIGVDVIPIALTKSEINAHLRSGDFDAVLMDHTFENNIQSLEEFFSAKGAKNYMGYVSRSFENLIRLYHQNNDSDIRQALIKRMQNVLNTEQPVNFLYFKWLTHYMVNVNKFENYRNIESRDAMGQIRPFEQWIIKDFVEK